MKLDAAQIGSIRDRYDSEPLADDNPALPKLQETFGDHSFFLDARGLHVVEPDPDHEGTLGYVIKIASWTEDQTQLRVHEPEVLPMAISLLPERKAG
ncbi:MAG TPA: hypothetical protein VLA52_11860 [Thermohalobaculum sp.]|nr:hypothetical protein [Thermohalobaculum sp.]